VLGGRIGAGGMGEVYRATDPRLSREVALKLMHSGSERDPERLKRFENEARAAAQLNHPNILAVLDVGTHQGVPYLVTELLEGQTLRERLARPFTPAEVVEAARQLLSGLGAAHARGIVHRDLKPENVFVTKDGRLKILDFGIARVEGTRHDGTQTATGAVVGTIGYMAPEQVRGLPADARADLFAFGCIFYELLGGRRAFQGATSVETGYAILNAPPAPLPDVTPAHLERLVRACLEKERDRRPPSADAVLAALSGSDAGPPAPASSGGMWKVALGASLMLAVVTVLATRRQEPAPQPLAIPREAPDAGPAPGLSMLDVPLPKTSSPEALALYRKGLQELHDGSVAEGLKLLEQSVALDPMFGAAHVRACLWGYKASDCIEARRLRTTLSPRDAALLDAIGRRREMEPIDLDAGLAAEAALLRQFPNDAEVAFVASIHHGVQAPSQQAESLALCNRALALDPTFAAVYWRRGMNLAHGLTEQEREHEFELCLAIAPQSGACMRNLAGMAAVRGDCAAYARYAQQVPGLEKGGAYLEQWVFDARLATGATRDELDAMLAQWPELRGRQLGDPLPGEALIPLYFGELDKVQLDGGADLRTHVAASLLAEERGDTRALAPLLRQFLAVRGTALVRNDIIADVYDGSMIELAMRAGLMSKAEVDDLIERWANELVPIVPENAVLYRKALRVAAATTPTEAKEAIDALPEPVLLDVMNDRDISATRRGAIGHALLLSGDVDKALPWLERAAHLCFSHQGDLFAQMRARLELGQALAQKGDVKGACAAYGLITAQWGHAKPRSVTADQAKQRMKSLHCAP
jgi:serine/threonine protein kinase/tetratricopeptide (TPR) repeat protein